MQHKIVQMGQVVSILDALTLYHNKRAFALIKATNPRELVSDTGTLDDIREIFSRAASAALRETDRLVEVSDMELAIVFDDLIDGQHAQLAGMKLERIFNQPLGNLALNFDTTIAVVYIARQILDEDDVGNLVEEARELSLAKSRESGFAFIDAADGDEENAHWLLETRLKEALNNHQIAVDYQAFIDLNTGDARYFEAIPRWRDKGVILAPDDYLPALQVETLGQFCQYFLRATVHDIVDQDLTKPTLLHFSNTILQQHDFAEFLTRELNFWGIEPDNVIIGMDVGSHTAISNRHVEGISRRYSALGLNIMLRSYELDDDLWPLFENQADLVRLESTAYVEVLKHQPERLSKLLKITDERGVQLIAAGVEDADTLEQLRDLGFSAGQGFYLGAPIDAPLLQTLG